MSGLIKSIGKAFKKIAKVVKKVALPALAIGAVILTGGAAIGALPALSASIGSLGLSSGLSAALVTAAKGATMGFITSAATGGNPIKGATTGFVTGGLLGAANAALKPATAALGAASSGASTAAGAATDAAVSLPGTGATISLPNVAAQGASQVASAAVPAATTAATTATTAGGGGLLSFLNQNPILAGQVLQGVGGGLMAKAQAGEERKLLKQIGANYDGFAGVGGSTGDPSLPQGSQLYSPMSYGIGKVQFDPKTGRIVPVAG